MQANHNYSRISDSYLFSTIAQKIAAYSELHPDKDIIRLGIGDVTQPIVPAVIEALHQAVDEQATTETFRGYGPEGGYDFLKETIALHDFQELGLSIDSSEIFVSDGAKSDIANLQELFEKESIIAIGDPVYPVYIDSNVLAGRLGDWDETSGEWSELVYLASHSDNNFTPSLPTEKVDVIYLCYPNNPTGMTFVNAKLDSAIIAR